MNRGAVQHVRTRMVILHCMRLVKKGHLAVVEILLKGKDCNIACNKHSNVLIVNSCRHGWLDVTRKLVEQYHCDLESMDGWDETPLHVACFYG